VPNSGEGAGVGEETLELLECLPVSVLQLTGVLAANGPAWYLVFQGLLGVAQSGIGLVMMADYRRSGTWGAPY
jgi:hypothetical protein